jgi:hypothetical protein
MVKYVIIALFSILSLSASGQVNDSLFAVRKGTSWVIKYTVKFGENGRMLANRFYVTDEALDYANEVDAVKKMQPGSVINIPVSRQNYYVNKPNFGEYHDLYYHVAPKDDITLIATYANVTRDQMRTWNNLHGNTLYTDQVLFVGWVKMVPYDTANLATFQAYPLYKKKPAETIKQLVNGGLDTAYARQTNNGTNVLTEKGTAVFFEKQGRNNIYYAFHNATPRNSVIKVSNPGTGKTIYVKVMGPIPDTKAYANSIIGICNAAKEELGVTENKAWVEISYSAN